MDKLHSENICKNCSTPFFGTFCNNCGEKVLTPTDRSFNAVVTNLFQAITFADGKIIKTLWLIVTRPGFVTREYVHGRRVSFLKPLSLFFALNLIYFLFPLIQLFNASLTTQLRSPLKAVMRETVARKMISENVLDPGSFSLIYDQKTAGLAKLIVVLFVLIACLPLNVLYRKRELYFADHMTFMVELTCFNLLINALALTIILRFTGLGHYTGDSALTVIFALTNFYFLIRAGTIFYNETGWRLIIKSFAMLLLLDGALEAYRAILFFVTMRAI